MAYMRLGDLLIAAGAITEEQLQTALQTQKQSGQRLGDVLIDSGIITQRQLIDALQMQLGVDYIDLTRVSIPVELAKYVPRTIAKKYCVVPVKLVKDELYVAMSDPLDFVAQEELKSASRRQIVPMIATRRAVEQAVSDMTSGRVMNRLCQGDVGSGKTMVAAACVWFAARNGWQSALMAPTEILARQHYENLAPLFARFGLHCALLTGSTRARERRAILAGLADGTVDLCIGTHALLTEDVQYARLGLVITDEQHRFGVDQRAALSKKADSPHMLVLSATPIPRTLALIIYGDLDVSIIDELPPGRQKVDTFAVGESYRQRLNGFIRKQVAEGHQVFIVCPLVAEDDQLPDERKAVTAYAQKLQNEVFPDLRISVLHGRMKSREKESVMAAFAAGESDILVSTTVVEVGVDVPNANLMVVENAERFGLSQLHQLRGRVGRGSAKSWCILLSDSGSDDTRRRLKVLTETNDGFRISEEDLKLRGPGDFFGQRQHGLPTLKAADLSCDVQLLDEAQSAARALLTQDPQLAAPAHAPLLRRIRRLFAASEGGLN